MTYTFTATGQTGTVTYPSGNQLGYGYSSAGQMNTLTWNGTPLVTNLQWTPLNQPGTWTWAFSGMGGSDIQGKRSYDTAGRVTTTELASYGYDAAGRITSLAQQLYRPSDNNPANSGTTLGTNSWTVGYDPVGRITSFIDTTAATTTTGPGTATFSYDSNGNRNASTQSTTAGTATNTTRSYAVASGSNRLMGYTQTAVVSGSTSTSTVSYVYNAAGDITQQGSKTFSFNAEQRLSSMATGPTVTSPTTYYTHNALGQRVFKTEPTTGTATTATNGFAFLYDEDGNLLGEYGTGGSASTGTSEYIWLPTANGPMPVATVINGTLFAVHSDNLNTPRRLSNTAAQAVWQWKYSAFGDEQPTIARNRFANTTTNPNPGTTTVAPVTFNLRYPGQYADVESGLNYNYFRSYCPDCGRYTQADPIGLDGGWNRFGYVGGDSFDSVDPRGLNPFLLLLGVGVIATEIATSDVPLIGGSAATAGLKTVEACVAKYEVGAFNKLKSNSLIGDGLDIHHAVQKYPASKAIPGYNPHTGPAIAIPAAEHRLIPTLSGSFSGTARDLLAKDIRDLRNYTGAPNASLQELIRLNKLMSPSAFVN